MTATVISSVETKIWRNDGVKDGITSVLIECYLDLSILPPSGTHQNFRSNFYYLKQKFRYFKVSMPKSSRLKIFNNTNDPPFN